jgi:hypothetical protein
MNAARCAGVDARALLASVRRENPEIARAEAEMGSRLTIARNVLCLRVRAGMSQAKSARGRHIEGAHRTGRGGAGDRHS